MAAMLANSALVKKGGLQMLFKSEVLKMKKIRKHVQVVANRVSWVLLLPLVILFSFSTAHAQAPTEVERAIALRVAQLKLGPPLPETPRPVQVATSPAEVWVQAFSGGRVYFLRGVGSAWGQFSGVLVVRGQILTRWLAEGGDGGALGHPLNDEQGCPNSSQRDRFQWFRHGLIHWRPETKDTVVHILDPIALFAGGPQICRPAPEEQDGRFRVILTGFSVNRQTNDHILEADGKGDEVYILAEVAQYDGVWSLHGQVWTDRERSGLPVLSARGKLKLRRSLASVLMGDANNQEAPRIKAGSAGDMGGFRTGDRFPTSEPWRLTGTPSANRLPMLLWEGDLRRDNDLVIIIPTIWEWDGGNIQPREQFAQDIKQ